MRRQTFYGEWPTNRNLQRQVEAGRFREDLFYRLNVFPIQVPPLRERMEDVPLLAKHFIETSLRELGCPKPRLTRAAIAKLENYHWPGNIRELRNVIERAIIISRGGALDFDLPVTESAPVPSRHAAHAKRNAEPEFLTEAELQRRERENLLIVLEKDALENQGRARRGGTARSQSHNIESANQKDGVAAARLTFQRSGAAFFIPLATGSVSSNRDSFLI